jgi:hypothetical protein
VSSQIPFAKLGISIDLEPRLQRDSPLKVRKAIAQGLVPIPVSAQLGALYVLATDPDDAVSYAARRTIQELPVSQVLNQVGIKTHPKVLEFLIEFRSQDSAIDERVGMMRIANERTVEMVARRADKALSELLSRNHERLLMTPSVYVSLHANPNCPDTAVARAESFLRMQNSLPKVPEVRPFRASEGASSGAATAETVDSTAAAPPGPDANVDLMAEIEAALRGDVSPTLVKRREAALRMFDLGQVEDDSFDTEGFSFDFKDVNDHFTFDLTKDHTGATAEEKGEIRKSLENQIKDMSVGQKIKLAYLGNKETRSHLIRDRNRIVAGAVVKSGRLTDQEVATYAGNKNLDSDVIREIGNNREWIRKYPVKVALVNNPKTPVAQTVSLVSQLQKKDLMHLTRNRNVPSVVNEAANRLYRTKYKKMK